MQVWKRCVWCGVCVCVVLTCAAWLCSIREVCVEGAYVCVRVRICVYSLVFMCVCYKLYKKEGGKVCK